MQAIVFAAFDIQRCVMFLMYVPNCLLTIGSYPGHDFANNHWLAVSLIALGIARRLTCIYLQNDQYNSATLCCHLDHRHFLCWNFRCTSSVEVLCTLRPTLCYR